MACAVIAGLGVSLTGCIPLRFSGYEPSGMGVRESAHCVAWIRDNLRTSLPSGVEMVVRAELWQTQETIGLSIRFMLPDGVSMQLLSPDLRLDSPAWAAPRLLPIYQITAPGPREFHPTAVLNGTERDQVGGFTLWFVPGDKGTLYRTDVPATPAFSLTMPLMSINGKPYQPPPVAFAAYRKWGLSYCIQ